MKKSTKTAKRKPRKPRKPWKAWIEVYRSKEARWCLSDNHAVGVPPDDYEPMRGWLKPTKTLALRDLRKCLLSHGILELTEIVE